MTSLSNGLDGPLPVSSQTSQFGYFICLYASLYGRCLNVKVEHLVIPKCTSCIIIITSVQWTLTESSLGFWFYQKMAGILQNWNHRGARLSKCMPSIPALWRKRQVYFWVGFHSGLHSEFYDSQVYIEKSCLEKPKPKLKQKTKGKHRGQIHNLEIFIFQFSTAAQYGWSCQVFPFKLMDFALFEPQWQQVLKFLTQGNTFPSSLLILWLNRRRKCYTFGTVLGIYIQVFVLC